MEMHWSSCVHICNTVIVSSEDRMNRDLGILQSIIQYQFQDPALLKQALIHPSYSGEMKMQRYESNQRLEFLGDAVLELTISEYLYKTHPQVEEGELTRKRSSLVFEPALYVCTGHIGLGDYLYLGRGEENGGGRNKPSILSDAFEALIGAIYLDGGYTAARRFIYTFLVEEIDELSLLHDSKSRLQEYVQHNGIGRLEYKTEDRGPDHQKQFHAKVYIGGEEVASGEGHSKKTAEQDAASNACRFYQIR